MLGYKPKSAIKGVRGYAYRPDVDQRERTDIAYQTLVKCAPRGINDCVKWNEGLGALLPAAVRCDMVLHQAFRERCTKRRHRWWGATRHYIGCFARDNFKQTCNTSRPLGVELLSVSRGRLPRPSVRRNSHCSWHQDIYNTIHICSPSEGNEMSKSPPAAQYYIYIYIHTHTHTCL